MTQITAAWLHDPDPQSVCEMLVGAGYGAWFVGGCVRNALLGAPVSDIDIATDATPETVLALAKTTGLRAIPTGIDHGTITVVAGSTACEVTTFRRDVETDGRRAVVAFSTDMKEDARRRDFTMNALYADRTGLLVDPLGGFPDLQAGRVRFIEDADRRIKEDYLRILRFFRFSAWYGDASAGIDAEGLAACAANIDGIATLPAERNWQEVRKLLAAPDPAPSVAAMGASGVLHAILPGADAGTLTVLVHIEERSDLSPDPIRRLAALGGMTDRLRLSKAEANRLNELRQDGDLGRIANDKGAAFAMDWLAVRAAATATEIDPKSAEFAQFAAEQVFPLKAADLMPQYQGPELGAALAAARARWVASGFTLTRDDLIG